MKNIEKLIENLESFIPFAEKENKLVSDGSVSWHLAHSLIVIDNVIKALQGSNPAEYKKKFNQWRFIIFFTNKIPRGRAKSPEIAKPKQVYTIADLQEKLDDVKKVLPILDELPQKSFFKHPVFGHLTAKKTKKFLAIHTNHHLKIVDDILKKN